MRSHLAVAAVTLVFIAGFASPAVFAANLPACNTQVLTRHGDHVSMSLAKLSSLFNQRLQAAHSHFTDLKLTAEGNNTLKVSGKKNGQPMSISGPLRVAGGGLQLHAKKITKNGQNEKGLMSLVGKNLANYVNLKNAPSLSVNGNNLHVNVDKLLGVAGDVTNVKLQNSSMELQFASQPCQ